MKRVLLALLLMASTYILLYPRSDCVTQNLLGYSWKGVVVPVEMCKVPEVGVYVQPELVGSRLAESLYVAYMAANKRHGPLPFGVILRVKGPVEYIDGRSADVGLYIGILSLLTGKRPVTATGVIGEDLYAVNGVANVRDKVSAIGEGPVIVPYSNRADVPEDTAVVAVKNLDEVDGLISSLPS